MHYDSSYNKNLMLSPNDKENHEVPNNEEIPLTEDEIAKLKA